MISKLRESLLERIDYLRVCGPLPCRHQKETRCICVCVVKRSQQRIFGCLGQRPLSACLAARLDSRHLSGAPWKSLPDYTYLVSASVAALGSSFCAAFQQRL